MVALDKDDNLFIMHIGDGDNRFNADTVSEINHILDEVEAAEGPAALVTVADGKIWHNGLDLDYMGTLDGDVAPFLSSVEAVFARMFTLPVPTVAAMQGHVFAGGAMFALAHDHRVMREDRGFFCLPEIDLGMSFTDGMAKLITAKVAQPALHRLAVLGARMPAPAAMEAGVVDMVTDLDSVVEEAKRLAGHVAPKAGQALVALRKNFYGDAIDALLGG